MFIKGIYSILSRHLHVWRSMFVSSFTLYTLEPLVILFAFGFGLGQAFDTMGGLPYIQFVVPGMMISSAMYAVCFEAGYGSFLRRVYQHTYDAMLASPISITQVVLGEISYNILRGLLPASIVCFVGFFSGGTVISWHLLLAIPVIAITSACLGAMILSYASRIKLLNSMDFMIPTFLTPQFLFCGVFMARDMFPDWVQAITNVFPLTHSVNLVRPLIAGQLPDMQTTIISLSYLLITMIIFIIYSIKGLKKALME